LTEKEMSESSADTCDAYLNDINSTMGKFASPFLKVDMATWKLNVAFPSYPWIEHLRRHQVHQSIEAFAEESPFLLKIS